MTRSSTEDEPWAIKLSLVQNHSCESAAASRGHSREGQGRQTPRECLLSLIVAAAVSCPQKVSALVQDDLLPIGALECHGDCLVVCLLRASPEWYAFAPCELGILDECAACNVDTLVNILNVSQTAISDCMLMMQKRQ